MTEEEIRKVVRDETQRRIDAICKELEKVIAKIEVAELLQLHATPKRRSVWPWPFN